MITSMKIDERTKEDWAHISETIAQHSLAMPQRIRRMVLDLEQLGSDTPINQLQHSLQCATRASRSGASDELIVAALCHDIGKAISYENHASIAAEILKPYLSHSTYEIVRTHTEFQTKHFYVHRGLNTNLRQKYARRSWFAEACKFSDEWDCPANDANYDTDSLDHFWPLLQKTFAAPKAASPTSSPFVRLLSNLRHAASKLLTATRSR